MFLNKNLNVEWMNDLLKNILVELGDDYDKYLEHVECGTLKEVVTPFMFSMYQKNYRGFKYDPKFLKDHDDQCEFKHFKIEEVCLEDQFSVDNISVFNKKLDDYVSLVLYFNSEYITGISSEVGLNENDFDLTKIKINH